jgi:hypothetical protein
MRSELDVLLDKVDDPTLRSDIRAFAHDGASELDTRHRC